MRDYDYVILYDENGEAYLEHHGIKGQKWGERRFQNPDGSLTPEGQKRYHISDESKKLKTAAKHAAIAIGAAAIAYGGYKLNKITVESLQKNDIEKGRKFYIDANELLDKSIKHFEVGSNWAKQAENAMSNSDKQMFLDYANSVNTRARNESTQAEDLYKQYKLYNSRGIAGKYSTKDKLEELKRLTGK